MFWFGLMCEKVLVELFGQLVVSKGNALVALRRARNNLIVRKRHKG